MAILSFPMWAGAQTYISPDNGYPAQSASRSAILQKFSDDQDLRDQRARREARHEQLQSEQRQHDTEATQREMRAQEQQRLRWYCATPEHRDEAACR